MRRFFNRFLGLWLPRLLWVPAALLLLAPSAWGQSSGLTEYQVKAAFVFNFAKFTDWAGESAREPALTVCVAGRDPFGSALTAFDGRSVNGREFRVRRAVPADELRGCHILYITQSEERRLNAYLHAATGPILTVSDIEGFVDAGGMIGLVVADERVQFDVNLTPTHQAGLKLSSQMLRLARNISGRGR